MKLVLLGPPGAGKGTHAQVLSKDFKVAHISTGDMLRESIKNGAALGLKAKQYMEKGELVPNEVVIGLVAERLSKADARSGFILDGFPRTPEQAKSLDQTLTGLGMPLDMVLYFKTSETVIIRRLSGRRVCSQCDKNYHTTNFKPKKEGVCDVCGSPLLQRPDDKEETVKHRLEVYEKQTLPLIEYYQTQKSLIEVDGNLELTPLNKVLVDLFKKRKLVSV